MKTSSLLPVILTSLVSLNLFAAEDNHLQSQFESKLCQGKWNWTDTGTITTAVEHPAVTKEVPDYLDVQKQRVSARVESHQFVAQCPQKSFREDFERIDGVACDWDSTQMRCEKQINDYLATNPYQPGQFIDITGSINNMAGQFVCNLNYHPMETYTETTLVGHHTEIVTPAYTEQVVSTSTQSGQSGLGKAFDQLDPPPANFSRVPGECSSGDHIDPELNPVDKFNFLTKKLDEFDLLFPDAASCDPISSESCAEFHAIIKNYNAMNYERIGIILPNDLFRQVFDRVRSKYPTIHFEGQAGPLEIPEPE